MHNVKKVSTIVTIASLSVLLIVFFFIILSQNKFCNNCLAYLQEVIETENVDVAKINLNKALKYVEEKNIINGDGRVLIIQSKSENDIGLWYNTLKKAQKELEELPYIASTSVKKRTLLRVKKLLTSNGKLIFPVGIYYYPFNYIVLWTVFLPVFPLFWGFKKHNE